MRKVWFLLIFLLLLDLANAMPKPAHRGLSLLQGNYPKARKQADAIIKILYDSKIKYPAVNFLIDGTFDYNEQLMMDYMEKLTQGDRQPAFEFYLLNGPAMRKSRFHYTDGFLARMSPGKFEKKLLSSADFRSDIAEHVAQFTDLFEFGLSRGITIYVCPMLEDNLSRKGFDTLLKIVKDALPEGIHYVRNPSSKDRTIPKGVYRESHNTGNVIRNSLLTNDGESLSLHEALSRARKAEDRDTVFLWWNEKWQGSGHNPPTPVWKRK